MKITRRQLGRIIRESLNESLPLPDWMDSAEYDRGYQDGVDQFPIADDANPDYDAGYEDGALDAELPEPSGPGEEEIMSYAAGRPWEHN
jgi:hypothetical protein